MPVIAIVGASRDRRKYGNKALRAFRAQGYVAIPIHPVEPEVEGERAYPTVLAYPGSIDEATLYVPPEVAAGVLDDVAAKGIPIVWLNPGVDAPAVVEKARALGLTPYVACSIVGAGARPEDF